MDNAKFAKRVQVLLRVRGVSSGITNNVDAVRIVVDGTPYEPDNDESPAHMAGRIYLDRITGADELRAVVTWIYYQREDFNDRFTAEQLVRMWRHAQLNDGELVPYADHWTEKEIAEALTEQAAPKLLCGGDMDNESFYEKVQKALREAIKPTPFSVYCQARAVVSMGRACPLDACGNDPRLLFAAMAGVNDGLRGASRHDTQIPTQAEFLQRLSAAFGDVLACSSDATDPLLVTLNVPRDQVAISWDFFTCAEGLTADAPRIIDVIIGGRFRPTRATWQKLIDAGLPMCSWQKASESWDWEVAK